MYSQFANLQLDETMDSNQIFKREAILSQLNGLRARKSGLSLRQNDFMAQLRLQSNDLSREIEEFEQKLRVLDNQQANINSQSNRPNQFLPLAEPHQSRGKTCDKHGLKKQLICYLCEKSICQKCSRIDCSRHAVYSKQKGLQKITMQLQSQQTPEVDRQIKLREKLITILSKKQKQLKQKVDNGFSLLEKSVQNQKIYVKKHFDQQIGRGIKQISSQIEKLKNIPNSLNKYKRKGMRNQTIEDFQLFKEGLKQSLQKIKQQSQEKVICEKIQSMKFNQRNIDKILQFVGNIDYESDNQEKEEKKKEKEKEEKGEKDEKEEMEEKKEKKEKEEKKGKEEQMNYRQKSQMGIQVLKTFLMQPLKMQRHLNISNIMYSRGYIKKEGQLKDREDGRAPSRNNKRQTELEQCSQKDFSNPKEFLKVQREHKEILIEYSKSEQKMKEDDKWSIRSLQGLWKDSKISYSQKRQQKKQVIVVEKGKKRENTSSEIMKMLDSLISDQSELEQRLKQI